MHRGRVTTDYRWLPVSGERWVVDGGRRLVAVVVRSPVTARQVAHNLLLAANETHSRGRQFLIMPALVEFLITAANPIPPECLPFPPHSKTYHCIRLDAKFFITKIVRFTIYFVVF